MNSFEDLRKSQLYALSKQDEQLKRIQLAEANYESNGDVDSLIDFWENIWDTGGLLFNGSRWAFRLTDLYITEKRYNDALRSLEKIKNPAYRDKKKWYKEKIIAKQKKQER